jgi:transglutaminase-like putative cysteine protease
MMFVLVMAVSVVFIGYIAPKSEPKWPDPVPFLKSAANIDDDDWLGNIRVKKQGYGENDERLGGPFQPDTTPVFYADVDTVHYWRAETKDFYTGKGWRSSRESFQPFRGELSTPLYEKNVKFDKKTASIEMTYKEPFTFLFYAGHPKQIIVNGSMVDLIENTVSGKISTGDLAIYHYSFQYDYPTFSIDALRNVSSFSYPDEIAELYLQLPEALPERVKTLAEEITKNADNPYDKAKAIESYFAGNGFSYETKEVAIPGANEDYVDQFLFETKKGYCDNFSTAMVVMLRSIGMPARWVKGFTGGDFVEILDDGKRRQLITNKHAHSWVEVYFPGSGWVPFEPTPGFTNPIPFESTSEEEKDPLEQAEQSSEQQEDEAAETEKQAISPINFQFQLNGKWLIFIGLVVLAIVFGVFYLRRLIATRWILYRLQKKSFDSHYTEWYTGLLTILKWYGFLRKPEQTLREFARHVDDVLATESMSVLTKVYEEIVYSNRKQIERSDDLRANWFTIIEKLLNIDRSRRHC